VPTKTKVEVDTAKKQSNAMDVSGLEQQYWSAKDTDFSVVQNRLYKKEKRFSFSAEVGTLMNDKFAQGYGLNLSGTYHLTERTGVELNLIGASLRNSAAVDAFVENHQALPDHNWFQSYVGASYIWVPMYGKVSWLDSRIIYFDLSVSGGGGFVTYATKTGGGDRAVTTGALDFSVTQSFFLSNHLAVRFDIRNLWYYENIHQYNDAGNVYPFKRRTLNNTTFLMLGATYFH
jgi:outer membrane beta-barrel protein